MFTTKQNRRLYGAIAAVVFLAESAAAGVLAAGYFSITAAAIEHVTIVAALTAWTALSRECRKDLRIPLSLTVMTAFMGPFGAGGVLTAIGFVSYYSRTATSFDDWYKSLFPEAGKSQTQLWRNIILSRDDLDQSSVASFSDILFFGTLSQKQELISLISKRFQPVFAPILRMALNDSNNAIRVQAASAITVIEDDFFQRSLSLATAVGKNPQDAALLLSLARLHDEYANAGILDHHREQNSRMKAYEAYRDSLKLQPKDLDARAGIGRLLMHDRKYEEAAMWLAESVEESEAPSELILIYLEALYRLQRFGELRRLATKYSSLAGSATLPAQGAETLKLWARVP